MLTYISWTVDQIFTWNNVVIIGWIALIFAPFQKLSKYLIMLIVLILSIFYSTILFDSWSYRDLNNSLLKFFHLTGWQSELTDPLMITNTVNHLRVIDLLIGQWMVHDFYNGYTFAYCITTNSNGTYQVKKSWTFGRLVFTLILLLTFIAAPFGFLLYTIAKYSFLKRYKIHSQVNIKDDREGNADLYINQLSNDSFQTRPIRFGDQFAEPLRTFYHVIIGLFGIFVVLTVVLPAYIGLIIYCRIVYRSSSKLSSSGSQTNANKIIPEYVRNVTATMRLTSMTTPINRRNYIWNLKFLLLQIATFIEYIPNSFNPIVLFDALQDYFAKTYNNVPYFVFGDGIGVGSHKLVKQYLQDLPPQKGFESLGWKVSSSQATFCDFTTIFVSSDNPEMNLGRNIIFKWLHAFPYHLHGSNSETHLQLSRLVPRKVNAKPDENLVYQAVGEVMFFLATGGEMRKNERAAFIDCVKNPSIFFPNWFNFLLIGHYFERKTLNSYYTLLQAFSRYQHGPALQAAFHAADNKKSNSEVLKLVAIVFSIAGSAAPAKLAVSVIQKLWEENDKEKYVRSFQNNPQNFIKECARLDKVVPMVNVLATKEIATEIQNHFNKENNNENIQINENTPIHCSIVSANRDKQIFKNPDDFIPERSDLNKLIVWNGVEEDIINIDETKRPIRYCPGHDLSLAVIQYVVERFSPMISHPNNNDHQKKTTDVLLNDDQTDSKKSFSSIESIDEVVDDTEKKLLTMYPNDNQLTEVDHRYYKVLDNYTKLVMKLMQIAVNESNSSPSRGIDMIPPFNRPGQDLGIFRNDMAKFIPTWDEDEPNGSGLSRRFARWLVNQKFWDFNDYSTEFDSLEEAIAWRSKMFSALPLPNTIYTDMFSDEAMTRLAFAGCVCHYTQRVEEPWQPDQGIPDRKLLPDAVYVNDMTGLSTFRVRQPFERYGAAAYFDKDLKIIAIYWSHADRLVKKGDQSWNHAKYVWRSTFFAYITIRDHLIVTHLIECNAFVSASRQFLPADHPLRKFLKPFTYHTVSVNYQAALSLVNERGLVHRIWAFDYDEFLKVCDYISMNYKFRLLPDWISKSMTPKINNKSDDEWDKVYPIYRDLQDFWKIIKNYVEQFFKIHYNLSVDNNDDHLPNDYHIMEFIREICKQLGIPGITSLKQFIDVLSQLIAASTAIHEHVGQISDYMTDPRFIGAKLQEGKEMQNIQTYTQILVLAVITGLRMPGILEDWSHLIEKNELYEENLKNYQIFKQELKNLSEKIDSRNKIRNYPFQSFNPKYIECSTSV